MSNVSQVFATELAAAFIAGRDDAEDARRSVVLDLFPSYMLSHSGQIINRDPDHDTTNEGVGYTAPNSEGGDIELPDLTPVSLTYGIDRKSYKLDINGGVLYTAEESRRNQRMLEVARALGRGLREIRMKIVKRFGVAGNGYSWLTTGWTNVDSIAGTPIDADDTDVYGLIRARFRMTGGDTFFCPLDVYDAIVEHPTLIDRMPDGVQSNALPGDRFQALLNEIARQEVRVLIDESQNTRETNDGDYVVDPVIWIGKTKVGGKVRDRSNPLRGAPRERVAGLMLSSELSADSMADKANRVMLAAVRDVQNGNSESAEDRMRRLLGFLYSRFQYPPTDTEIHTIAAASGFAQCNPNSGAAMTACITRS